MAGRDIPNELIEIIRKHLDLKNEIHVNQFRAVCQSWRSSIPPFKPPQPQPQLPYRFCMASTSSAPIETVVYHVVPPPANDANERKRGWLIRLSRNPNENQKPKLIPALLPPLSRLNLYLHRGSFMLHRLDKSFSSFRSKGISFLDFGLSELAKHYHNDGSNKLAVSFYLDFPVVAMVRDGKLYHGLQQVILAKNIDEPFDDVIFYQGKVYAVSKYGRAIVLDYSSSMCWTEIAPPISSKKKEKKKKKKQKKKKKKKKNYLVESFGELLLVERDGCVLVGKGGFITNMHKTELKFKVYKLDEIRKKWVAMEPSDLSDRILFVGEDGCFSVSTRDFPGCQGSCIYFCYEFHKWGCDHICSGIGVFNFDNGRAWPLESYPASANIFLPPPTSPLDLASPLFMRN